MGKVKEVQDPYSESFPLLREENEATKGIGPSVLNALVEFSLNEELLKAATMLSQNIKVHKQDSTAESLVKTESNDVEGPLTGMKVVFTGTIEGLSRSKAKEIAKAMGAKSIGNSVSKSTDLVVAGQKVGKKLEEAKEYNVRILSSEEFMEMVDEFTVDRTNVEK
jgi:DNA ligase (NAD+)